MSKDATKATWCYSYEKGLVDILHDHKDNPRYRGQNGWVSEGLNVITSKFSEGFAVAHFTKQQLQEKWKELKANYKAIRDARKNSGVGWDDSLGMIHAEDKIWDKLVADQARVAKFRKKPFPFFNSLEALYERSVANGDLNFTSTQQPPPPAPAERSTSEQSIHQVPQTNDLTNFGTNPFATSFDGQEISSGHNEAQSALSNHNSRKEGGSGRKRKQSHIGSTLEEYVEFKKSQTNKTLEALNEKKICDEGFSVNKCTEVVEAMDELMDEEKSYALEVFETELNKEMFMTTKKENVRLLWLRRKVRVLSESNA